MIAMQYEAYFDGQNYTFRGIHVQEGYAFQDRNYLQSKFTLQHYMTGAVPLRHSITKTFAKTHSLLREHARYDVKIKPLSYILRDNFMTTASFKSLKLSGKMYQ